MLTKDEIIKYLIDNCEEDNKLEMNDSKYHNVNEDSWTIADLFVRQCLNNGCDGFGMNNVNKVYKYLTNHKDELIKYNLLSETGRNNFGFILWQDYGIGDE